MHSVKRHALFSRMARLIIATVVLSGCSLATDLGSPAAVVKASGDGQSAQTNTALTTPLSVFVITQLGEPVPNITVTWSESPVAGGTLTPVTSVTDENGTASTTYTTPATSGQVTIQAKVNGIPPLDFIVIVLA